MRLNEVIDNYFFSKESVVLHSIWFAIWLGSGASVNWLTNLVSLEAIYLSIFIGIAQKTQHKQTREAMHNEVTESGK